MIVRGGGKGRGKNGTDRERKREERHFSLAFPVNDSPAIAGIPSTATITSRKRSLSRMVTLVEIEIWTSYFFLPFFLHSVPPLSLPCPSLRPMITRRIFVEFTLKNCAMHDRYIALIDLWIEFWNIVSFLPNTILLNFTVTDTISIMIICIYIY